jgi:AraC-like DNA-binding protein
LAPGARLEAFKEVALGYEPFLAPGERLEDFVAICTAWLLQDMVLTANSISPAGLDRSVQHIQAYGRDTYTFVMLTTGEWQGQLDWGEVHVGSGEVCIMDFTVPWKVVGTAQDNIMLVVPRALVTSVAPNAPRLHGRVVEGASGRMLAEHIIALTRHLPDLRPADIPAIREATLALIAAAVNGISSTNPVEPRSGAGIRAASPAALRRYIEHHLTDPGLDMDKICAEAAVTRSTLYRAFESDGGVTSYIRRRRLEAAHARLSDPNETASLADLADLFCFSSPAHFSTAFRRRFGYTPRDTRRSIRQDATALFRTYREILGGSS